MAQANLPFEKRLKQITRKHDQLAKGAGRSVTSDGLIVMQPRAYRPKFPLRFIIVLVVLGFVFKGLLLASIGNVAYAERVTPKFDSCGAVFGSFGIVRIGKSSG